MAELDMVKFFEHPENQRTIGWEYSYFSGTDRTPVQVDLRNNINTKGEFVSKPYIPSNTSFLVHLEQSALSNPYLEVTPEMIRDYDNSPSQQIRYAPEQNRKVLIVEGNRNGVISSCVLFEKHDANNNFDTKEDTRLIMMKKDMNPSAIYTNTDNVALSINIMNNIDMTPLGYSVIDNSEQESLTITFKGVENFSKIGRASCRERV